MPAAALAAAAAVGAADSASVPSGTALSQARPLFAGAGRDDPTSRTFFGLLLAATLLPILWLSAAGSAAGAQIIPGWATLFLIWLGGSGHVAGSYAFYLEPKARAFMTEERSLRFVWAPLMVVAVVGLTFSFSLTEPLIGWLILGYWAWQVHHYSRQNIGILGFLARAERLPPSEAELRALRLTDLAGIAASLPLVSDFAATAIAPMSAWFWWLGLAAFVAAWGVWLVDRLGTGLRSRARDLGMVVLLLFYAPLFVFDSFPLAVTGFATAHGLQYFLFLTWVARVPSSRQLRAFLGLGVCTLGLGVALFLSGLGARGTLYGLGLGVVMAHFVIDAGIWRLREPFQRSYMAERFSFL